MRVLSLGLLIIMTVQMNALYAAPKFDDCAKVITAGKKVYAAQCLMCHGDKGDGKGPTGKYLKPAPRRESSNAD